MGLVVLPSTLVNGTVADADQVMADLNAIVAQVNGNLSSTNFLDGGIATADLANGAVTGIKLDPAILAALGVNDGVTVRRGKSIIVPEDSRTNVAYGTMAAPDVVSGIVLPNGGLIRVNVQAMTKGSAGSNAARVALFVGATQLKVAGNTAPILQEAPADNGGAAVYGLVETFPGGLFGIGDSAGYAGDAVTGQAIAAMKTGGSSTTNSFFAGGTVFTIPTGDMRGGCCTIFAGAGTYDISLQFKASSGSVSAKNRSLWVEAIGF